MRSSLASRRPGFVVPGLVLLAGLAATVSLALAHSQITSENGKTVRWPSMPIPYYVNEGAHPDIFNGSDFTAIHAAFETWESIPTADVRFEYRGTVPTGAVGRDGVNLVTFADPGILPTGIVGITFVFTETVGDEVVLVEADIALNPNVDLSTSGEPGAHDLQAVITHNAGHMLGLGHSAIVSSAMNPHYAPTRVESRVLQEDDVIGVTRIYPNAANVNNYAAIEGTVTRSGDPLFGAHVVAMTSDGTPRAGVLTGPDGTYRLDFLEAGLYKIYAEPLDGPMVPAQMPELFADADTAFATTYFPQSANDLSAALRYADVGTTRMDIAVLPPNASEFDLLVPAFNNSVPKAPPGFISVGSFTVGGVDIVPGSEFSASTPLVEFRSPNYGGRLSTEASTSASLQTWIHPDTPPGPKNVIASLAGTWSTLTGGFTVTSPRPGGLTVFPTSGPREGGTAVQIYGQNFVPGAQVFFDGLPADVQTLTPAFIGVATPPNMAGPVSVQVFNPDGGMGILRGGFRYTSPPPVVSGVEPGLRTPGSPIVISGENFDPRPANVDVRLGGQRLRVVGSTASRIEALVPCGAESGSLTVSIFGQQAAAGMFAVEPPAPSANTAPATASFVDVISNGGTDITPHDRDNGAAFIDVPFPVCLFSDPFIPDDRLTIAVNGWMNLDGFPFGEFQNAPLPATTFPRPSGVPAEIPGALVAPFFDDLVFGPTGTVSTLVTGTAPGRRFIVQWSGLSVIDEFGNDLGADLDFQAVIYEGSNDIRFVYRMMDGARAGGTGATVGLQNLARDTAIQTGYNQTAVRSDMAVTYRFGSGTYSEEQTGQLVPPTPVVSDEGRRTPSTSTLAASWTLPSTTAPSRIVGFDYAIGTTPGGTDVRGFTPVEANSVTVAGLALAEGGLYYFAVRARDALGRTSEAGVSDGIEVHTGFAPATSTFPYVTSGADVFTGLAIMADEATDAVLVAIDPDGELVAGMGIRNPRTIELGAGEQWARLVDEIFGLPAFDGWIEVRSSSASLRSYVSVGARSLERVDGAAPSLPTTDFHLLHGDATAVLVNPGWTNVTATIRSVSGSNDELEVAVPARSRREVGIGRAVRITTTGPVAAVEVFGSATNLAIGSPVATTNESLVFPHAVDGGGYASRITILNAGAAPVDVSASFGAERGDLAWSPGAIPPGETIEFAIPTPELANPPLVTGAVWVDATGPISGTIDIFRDSTLVSVPAWEPRSEMVFPHVADLDGFFTGIAMTAGPAGAEVLIDIRTASGETSGHAVVTVPADGHVSRLIREFVTDFEGQNGGYIRLESDQPIWAWQIYGTLDAMASGPPL